MSVAYEPRSFIHEGTYPPLGDEPDHAGDQRFTDSEVAEHLSHYAADAAILPDDRGVIGDERDLLAEDDGVMHDPSQLDLDVPGFSSPLHDLPLPDPVSLEGKEASSGMEMSALARVKPIPKPDREVQKRSDGKFHCPLDDCKEETRSFSRKCEWNKHMDKHERPYRCPAIGCENLPGFTYSGGLLRHEREVHGKHGGPKNTVNCPYPNCKRHTGKGFSRQENLNEHLRRVHTSLDASTPPAESGAAPTSPGDSEMSGTKRKRGPGYEDELAELREECRRAREEVARVQEENRRVREENEKLEGTIEQQSLTILTMTAQITQLQELRLAPTAHMT